MTMTNGPARAVLIQRLRTVQPIGKLDRDARELWAVLEDAIAALDADAKQGAMRKRRVSTLLADIVRVKNSELDSLRERLEQEIARLRQIITEHESGVANLHRVIDAQTQDVDRLRRERDVLREALREARELPSKWRDAAVWEHEDMSNTQSAQTFDQCADELAATLAPAADAPPREGKE